MPFEFTYQPLIPGLTTLWASLGGISQALALQRISGVIYCLAPVTLFLMAWLLTRAPGYSFFAALFYSLLSPTQLLVTDPGFEIKNALDARRLYLVGMWDELPHLAALALLPVTILFLYWSIQKRSVGYSAVTAALIALTTSASLFGPPMIAMGALCLLFALPAKEFKRNLTLAAIIGLYAFALSLPFLPPSLLAAIPKASQYVEEGWTLGSVAAAAIVLVTWLVLWKFALPHVDDWRLRFFVLFAFLTSSIPLFATYLHWQFLPQAARYKMEMEFALPLLVLFGARRWFERAWQPLRAVVVIALLALAVGQLVHYGRFARNVLRRASVTETIEYRVTRWVEQNLPGVRLLLPGSIEKWADAFAPIQQFSGESWSTTYNQTKLEGFGTLKYGSDPRFSLAWSRAFGVGAIAVSGPKSPEFWKPFWHPEQFEGVLPVLWRQDDVTIYRIPQRTTSLAHVISEAAIVHKVPVRPGDIEGIERYVAALDDPSMPFAELRWEGNNRIRIHATASVEQALSVQVSFHPGWHASSGGHASQVKRDGLGLMWLQPRCAGPCDVELNYDGGWELRICRYIGVAAIIGLFLIPLAAQRRRVDSIIDVRNA